MHVAKDHDSALINVKSITIHLRPGKFHDQANAGPGIHHRAHRPTPSMAPRLPLRFGRRGALAWFFPQPGTMNAPACLLRADALCGHGGRQAGSQRSQKTSSRFRSGSKNPGRDGHRHGRACRKPGVGLFARRPCAGNPLNLSLRMVGTAGFEPTTLCPPGRCATRLRYAPTSQKHPALQRAAHHTGLRAWRAAPRCFPLDA